MKKTVYIIQYGSWGEYENIGFVFSKKEAEKIVSEKNDGLDPKGDLYFWDEVQIIKPLRRL